MGWEGRKERWEGRTRVWVGKEIDWMGCNKSKRKMNKDCGWFRFSVINLMWSFDCYDLINLRINIIIPGSSSPYAVPKIEFSIFLQRVNFLISFFNINLFELAKAERAYALELFRAPII
jgi:hypothetical protein